MNLVDALNALHSGGAWITSCDVAVSYDKIPADGENHRDWASSWTVRNVDASTYGWWLKDMGWIECDEVWLIDGYVMKAESVMIGPDLFYTVSMRRNDA